MKANYFKTLLNDRTKKSTSQILLYWHITIHYAAESTALHQGRAGRPVLEYTVTTGHGENALRVAFAFIPALGAVTLSTRPKPSGDTEAVELYQSPFVSCTSAQQSRARVYVDMPTEP